MPRTSKVRGIFYQKYLNMSRRKILFEKGKYYHVYNRGCNRLDIFREEENYRFLTEKIASSANDCHISVIAYCLMPNHYHLLVRQDSDVPVSRFIQTIFNSYTKAFNKRYERTGTLFEERFEAKEVDTDEYLIHLSRYIHLNPVKAKLVPACEDWEFSNYREWIGLRQSLLFDTDLTSTLSKNFTSYKSFVGEYNVARSNDLLLQKYLFDED
ncbi:MAG: transposase [Bacteroidota bacterium]